MTKNGEIEDMDVTEIVDHLVHSTQTKDRSCVAISKYYPKLETLEYLNIGDTQLYHFTIDHAKMKKAKVKKEKERKKTTDEVDVDHSFMNFFESNKNLKIVQEEQTQEKVDIILKAYISPQQTFFNFIQPRFVGRNGDVGEKGSYYSNTVSDGDVVVTLNRGVADALYEEEISEIVMSFLNVGLDFKIEENLWIVADSLSSRAMDKIKNFEEKRPLVDRLKKNLADPSLVSVDECLTAIDYYHK